MQIVYSVLCPDSWKLSGRVESANRLFVQADKYLGIEIVDF